MNFIEKYFHKRKISKLKTKLEKVTKEFMKVQNVFLICQIPNTDAYNKLVYRYNDLGDEC